MGYQWNTNRHQYLIFLSKKHFQHGEEVLFVSFSIRNSLNNWLVESLCMIYSWKWLQVPIRYLQHRTWTQSTVQLVYGKEWYSNTVCQRNWIHNKRVKKIAGLFFIFIHCLLFLCREWKGHQACNNIWWLFVHIKINFQSSNTVSSLWLYAMLIFAWNVSRETFCFSAKR